MPRPPLLLWLAALAVLFSPALQAQQPDSTPAPRQRCAGCPRRKPLLAVGEVFFTNIVVNRVDAWARHQDWAHVGPQDWSRNLRLGWEWDEDEFPTNMFAHPYHGALYFNGGRSNGLSYWESAPLAFMGSWSWENLGEKFRPSLNDFFMTSFGGITLGEVYHRVGASIRDNSRRGGTRLLREFLAMPIDPLGGLNRLFRGDWTRVGPNPPEHKPEAFVFRLGLGGRATVDTGVVDSVTSSATIVADLAYGDRFLTPFREPFDVFSVRAQISPGGGGINVLRASGRLYSRNLNRATARHRQVFEINQRYDYLNNPAFRFGGQSVEAGLASRWALRKGFGIRTELFVDGVFLGALDAPYGGFGERSYDFGPGAGFRFDIAFENNGVAFLTLLGRSEYLHSVSGAEADHFVSLGGVEIAVPIARGIGIGLHAVYSNRVSRYSDQPEERREFPEARLLLNWTRAARPLPAVPTVGP